MLLLAPHSSTCLCVVLSNFETFPRTFKYFLLHVKILMWLIYLITILIETGHCRVNEPWLGITLELSYNSSRVKIPQFGAIIFGRFALPKKLVLSIFLERDWKFLCHYHNIFWVHLCSIGLGKKFHNRNPKNLQEILDKLRNILNTLLYLISAVLVTC